MADYQDDNMSMCSDMSRRSTSSTDSSVARREALVRQASATAALEFEQQSLIKRRLMVEKEEELARLLARERAENEQAMKVLAAQKEAAIADAELAAIDQVIREENEENNDRFHGDLPNEQNKERYRDEIMSNTLLRMKLDQEGNSQQKSRDKFECTFNLQSNSEMSGKQQRSISTHVSTQTHPLAKNTHINAIENTAPAMNPVAEDIAQHTHDAHHLTQRGGAPTYQSNVPGPDQRYLDSQLFATTLARQNLPKYEPDVFTGDVTLYHAWKGSFQAMLENTNVTPAQEILYIHNYTRSDPRKLVDSYRRRVYGNAKAALADIWAALDSKYGNAAAITRSYLESLESAADFSENDRERLNEFANICVDIDSQMPYLPGLACLNYANVLHPVVRILPRYLKEKWAKIVVKHAESNQNEYPPFTLFSSFVEKQHALKNHPNVLDEGPSAMLRDEIVHDSRDVERSSEDHVDVRVFKSTTEPHGIDGMTYTSNEFQFCPLHHAKSHNLSQCTLYERASMAEKWDIARDEGLCFRCLSPGHSYVYCDAVVTCRTCGSKSHGTLFHEESHTPTAKNDVSNTSNMNVLTACTELSGSYTTGVSYSKMLLVDVYPDNHPEQVCRVYARADDQSNVSMATTDLLDQLNCTSPPETYCLSTCNAKKETVRGRRMCGLTVRSVTGKIERLPPVYECHYIPVGKQEIPTPDQVRQFGHLCCIADDIPTLDKKARVMLVIGRDAPELLKVRGFINGPIGAPWAQKLRLGWTVSGQVEYDRRMDGAPRAIDHLTPTTNDQTKTLRRDDNAPVGDVSTKHDTCINKSTTEIKTTRKGSEVKIHERERCETKPRPANTEPQTKKYKSTRPSSDGKYVNEKNNKCRQQKSILENIPNLSEENSMKTIAESHDVNRNFYGQSGRCITEKRTPAKNSSDVTNTTDTTDKVSPMDVRNSYRTIDEHHGATGQKTCKGRRN